MNTRITAWMGLLSAGAMLWGMGCMAEPENVAEAEEAVGESCESNGDCAAAEYCAKKAENCGGKGACAVRPAACTWVYKPVCGCDGNTYSNACFAAGAGASVAHNGPCATACKTNDDCVAGTQYCKKKVGQCKGEGECETRPVACMTIADPVCGCDGNTYSNACYAAGAGVSLASEDPCY